MNKFVIFAIFLGFSGPARAEGCWTRLADMPTARSEIAVVEMSGELYVAGGIQLWGGTQKAFESYDIAANEWRERAALPHRIHHVALAAHGGQVYASGGYTSLRFTPNAPELWAYDPGADQWQARAPMPGPRGEHAMVTIGDRIYVFGGRGETGQPVWSYDPAADSWSTDHAPMPTYRHSAAIVYDPAKHRVLVMGGRGDDYQPLATVEAYDPARDRWDRLPDLPTPRAGHGAALIGAEVHLWGGETPDAEVLDTHDIWDLATDRWRDGPALPVARHGIASLGVGQTGYIVGGGTLAGWRTIYSAQPWITRFSAQNCPK